MPQAVKKEKCAQSGACPTMSDYRASISVAGVKNEDVGRGVEDQLPQVEANAAALGRLVQAPFGGFAFDSNASAALVGNMLQYAGITREGREQRRFSRTPRRAAHCRRG